MGRAMDGVLPGLPRMNKLALLEHLDAEILGFQFATALPHLIDAQYWVAMWERHGAGRTITYPYPDRSGYARGLAEVLDATRLSEIALSRRGDLLLNYNATQMRAAVNSTYEVVVDYAYNSGQMPMLRAAPWYGFLVVARHAVSHANGLTGILRRWPDRLSKEGVVAVNWRSRTIDQSAIGQLIEFSPAETMRLMLDVYQHVEERFA